MSKLGAKTYSRRNECKTSLQFDHLLAEKGNKPSTAKVSVAAVHRWGMTSFTSLRKAHLNGQKDVPPDNIESVKRLKKEPHKVAFPPTKDPFSFETDIDLGSADYQDHPGSNREINRIISVKPKKFFKSNESLKKGSTANADSSKKINIETLRLPVFQNCYVSKLDDGLKLDSRKVIKDRQTCDVIDDNAKSFQTCVQLDASHVSNQSSSDCVTLSVNLDSEKSLSFPQVFHNQSLCETKNQLYTESTSSNIGNTESSIIQNPCRTFIKVFDHVPQNYDSSEIVSMKQSTKTDICDTSLSTNIPETKWESADSGITFEEDVKRNEFIDFQNVESLDKEQNTKLRNVFRSKKIFNSTKKPKAVYNHRHWQSLKEDNFASQEEHKSEKDDVLSTSVPIQDYKDNFIDEMDEILKQEELQNLPGEQKLYTVVRNVKQAYQVHESGEAQEFNDDIEYLLDGLQCSNGTGTRCLSVLGLATKCMGPAFRIHLRAHGTMPKIFSALQDAPTDPNLSLCVATLLFVLSQDRLTMDIDASTLCMMLQLLENDQEIGNPDKDMDLILEDPALCAMQEKHREKVYQLCEQMQQKGHAKHLKLDNINASILAMEALLSLTSRKAGEWFKEEMRILHGLDRIVDAVSSCVDSLTMSGDDTAIKYLNEVQLDKIQKVDRCLRVLENVTYMNFENQDYLLQYKDSVLSICCLSLIKLCKSSLLRNQSSDDGSFIPFDESQNNILAPVLFCLLSVMKVLLNITFENSLACARIGSENGLMENVMLCIFQVPRAVPNEKRFDLLVLSLGLMINLVEHCCENRKRLMETVSLGSFDSVNDGYEIPASEGLVEVLHSRLEAARLSEEQADELLSSTEVKPSTEKKDNEIACSHAECLEETLMKTLQKAGKHMEHSIIAAYISLLLGCVMQNNEEYITIIKDYMPDGKFDVMVDVLKKFMSFVSLTGSVGSTGVKSIQRIIEVFNSSS